MTASSDLGARTAEIPLSAAPEKFGAVQSLLSRFGAGSLAGPAVLFMLLFCVYPLLRLFYVSIGGDALSPANYQRLYESGVYLRVVRNTFVISIGVTLLTLLIAYPVAYAMTQVFSKTWQRRLIILVVIPYLTSQLARIYAWRVILGDNGPVNSVIAWLGLAPPSLLYNTTGMIIGMTHILLPLMVMPLYASMRNIDPTLMRAAGAMGGGPIRVFFSIFLPLSMPGVRSGCILVFVGAIGAYIIPSGLGGLGDSMVSNLIQSQVETTLNFGLAGAAAFILLGMTLLAFVIFGGDIETVYGARTGQTTGVVRPRRRILSRAAAPLQLNRLAAAINARVWSRRLTSSRQPKGLGRGVLVTISAAVLAFLVAPSLIIVVMSFSADSFMAFPPSGFSLRWYESYALSPQWRRATGLSFVFAIMSAALSLLLGLAAAYALVRGRLPFKRTIFALMLAPMIVPTVVNGIALFGLLADLRMVGTVGGVLIAHTLGGVAFVVVIGMSALSGLDRRLELAALSLGAPPLTVFRRIIAPLMLPGLLAGALFAFIHSFDEVIITYFVSGTRMQTLPVKMWSDMLLEVDPTIAAVSALLVALPLLWLALMESPVMKRSLSTTRP